MATTAITLCLLYVTITSGESPDLKQSRPNLSDREPDVDYIPTPHDVVVRMLELAAVKKDDVVYDLGCGDGRIVVAAAKKHGCHAIGFDIDPKRVKESRDNITKNRLQQLVKIEQQDLFKVDLSPSSVVMLYLSTKLNTRLLPQLAKLKPGSRIVSHQFGIHGVKPDKVVEYISRDDGRKHTLYLWTVPLTKDG